MTFLVSEKSRRRRFFRSIDIYMMMGTAIGPISWTKGLASSCLIFAHTTREMFIKLYWLFAYNDKSGSVFDDTAD